MRREIDNATPARRTPILKNICERMFLMYNFLITINLKDRLKPTQCWDVSKKDKYQNRKFKSKNKNFFSQLKLFVHY